MEWTFPTTDPSPTGMLPFPDSVITPLVNEPVCTPRSGDKLLFLLDDDVTRTDGYTGWRSLGILSYTTAISTWNTFEYMNNKLVCAGCPLCHTVSHCVTPCHRLGLSRDMSHVITLSTRDVVTPDNSCSIIR